VSRLSDTTLTTLFKEGRLAGYQVGTKRHIHGHSLAAMMWPAAASPAPTQVDTEEPAPAADTPSGQEEPAPVKRKGGRRPRSGGRFEDHVVVRRID
jgi:hypothetical protein